MRRPAIQRVRGGLVALGIAAWAAGAAGCGTTAPAPPPTQDGAWTEAQLRTLGQLRLDTTLPPDPSNAVADDPAAAALGRALFYDPGLSGSGAFSCASCHVPALDFTDARPLAVAAGTSARHTPPIRGSQLGPWYFWDGRADSLWAQAAGPLEHPNEMDGDRVAIARRVLTVHRDAYVRVYGDVPEGLDLDALPAHARPGEGDDPREVAWRALPPAAAAEVDAVFVRALKAIAAFERTLLPTEAPFDRFVDAVVAGDPAGGGHLSDEAVAGLRTFIGRGQCVACHSGPFFTDRAFHVLSLPDDGGGYDPGRAEGAFAVKRSPLRCDGPWSDTADCPELRYLNPAFPDFQGAFKTPTLRNVARTAPYMHRGQLPTLDDVLAFYSELPGSPTVNHRELTLQPLALSAAEVTGLKAFLEALTGPLTPEMFPPGFDVGGGAPRAPGAP